jgi:hypothetical protein
MAIETFDIERMLVEGDLNNLIFFKWRAVSIIEN